MGIEQQPGRQLEIDKLGRRLSLAIKCSVSLVYDKPVFECHHGVRFLQHTVLESSDQQLKDYHDQSI